MIKDNYGHEWYVSESRHPFLTGWKCKFCNKRTFTYDDMIPADLPKLEESCEKDISK